MNTKAFFILFLIRMFSAVGFAVLYSGLALYLIEQMNFTDDIALDIVGLFIVLNYSLALISGLITGRWLSYIQSICIGVVLQAAASFFIFYDSLYFFWGCALFLTGSLFLSTTINMIVTERYQTNAMSREKSFMWLYVALNLGYIIGFSLAGYFQMTYEFSSLGYIVPIIMLVSFSLAIFYKKCFSDKYSIYSKLTSDKKLLNYMKLFMATILLFIIIYTILINAAIVSNFIIATSIIALIVLLAFDFSTSSNKKNTTIFILLIISYLLFWCFYFFIPTGLTLFIRYNTEPEIWGIFIAPAWYQNLNSAVVIFGTPVLVILMRFLTKTYQWTMFNKFSAGIFFISVGFLLLIIGIVQSDFLLVSAGWVALTYCLLSVAEVFIAPIGFSVVGQYVEQKKQNVMMGAWVSTLGLGGLIASQLSSLIEFSDASVSDTNQQYLLLFSTISLMMLAFSVLLWFLKRYFSENNQYRNP